MNSVSLIIRAHQSKYILFALKSITTLVPDYLEIIVAVSPSLPQRTLDHIMTFPRVRLFPGTNKRDYAGAIHFSLLDQCTGDWIINLDDDDFWTYMPDLSTIPDDVGLIYGNAFYQRYYLDVAHKEYSRLQMCQQIIKPENANRQSGAFWIARRSAWEEISTFINQDRTFIYSDWRIVYYIVQQGWKAMHIPKIFGIIRRFDFDSIAPYSWEKHASTLPTLPGKS